MSTNAERITALENELKLIETRVSHANELATVRIEEFEKRGKAAVDATETARAAVEKRTRMLGISAVFGLPLGLAVMLWAVYGTATKVAETTAEQAAGEAAKQVEWEKLVSTYANKRVSDAVSPEKIGQAINDETLRAVVDETMKTKPFKDGLSETVISRAAEFGPSKDQLKALAEQAFEAAKPKIEADLLKEVRNLAEAAKPKPDELKESVTMAVNEVVTTNVAAFLKREKDKLSDRVDDAVETAFKTTNVAEVLSKEIQIEVADAVKTQFKKVDLSELISAQQVQSYIDKAVAQEFAKIPASELVSSDLVERLFKEGLKDRLLSDEAFQASIAKAVVTQLDEALTSSEAFKRVVQAAVDRERDRVQKLIVSKKLVDAASRKELEDKLVSEFVLAQASMRKPLVYLRLHPFQDPLEIVMGLYEYPVREKPFGIRLSAEGLNATTAHRRELLEKHLEVSVFDDQPLRPSGEKFEPGYDRSNFKTREEAARALVKIGIAAAEKIWNVEAPYSIRYSIR